MPEALVYQSHADTNTPQADEDMTPEQLRAATAELEKYLGENASQLGTLFGLRHFSIKVGEAWATNMETGEVTAGIADYLKTGYTAEMAAHDICHEVAAHLREVEYDPKLTREVIAFINEPKDPHLRKATGIFHNIFSDIAGNKLVYETVPTLRGVANDLYGNILFTQDDLTEIPRHLQFLYKLIRQEMIADSDTHALPEVDALINLFRDYDGKGGDLIAYSTQVAKSRTEAMSAREKFELWTKVIYPQWLELFVADTEDEKFQKQSASEPQSGSDEQTESNDSESQPEQDEQNGSVSSGEPNFSKHYDEYHDNLHPEHLSHEDIDKLTQAVKQQQAKEERDKRQETRENADKANPTKQLDAQIRRETGHSLAEKRRYDSEVERWAEQIKQLRDVFASILNERIATKRHLRGNHAEGVLLNPETLAQTYIDVQSNHPEPPAYADYETYEAERNLTGKTDYVFVYDRSGSMDGEKSQAAASSLVIMLEALAAMQRDIREAEQQQGVTIDIDIRTALYTFNHGIDIPKKLGSGLSDKERFDAYSLVASPSGGNADSHVLQQIEEVDIDTTRRQVVIVVSDGQADDKVAARSSIDRLRAQGWHVYGVSIGSEDAVELYLPHSQRIDDPALLPAMLQSLVERTLA